MTSVRFYDGALTAEPLETPREEMGARVVFEGIVRATENGRAIEALDYEAYQPMAERVLREIAASVEARHRVTVALVEHSVGRVEVGACSFRLVVDAPHRKEVLAAADEFIDRMKTDAPIWKSVAQPRIARKS